MGAGMLCPVCGNETEAGSRACRYCGAELEPDNGQGGTFHKTINLEYGRPGVEAAIEKLLSGIQAAKMERVRFLTLIHGYGSSGKGGLIKIECLKTLDYLCMTKSIKGYIRGEEFSRTAGPVKDLLRQFPALAGNKNLNRYNQGITLVHIQ
jgi:hypothetical protein